MKTLLLSLVLLVAVGSAQAQIYRPTVVGQTTVLGAVAGALIGGHNHDRWGEGAVIGAVAGAVLGSVIDDQRQPQAVYYSQPTVAPVVTVPCAPVAYAGSTQVVYVNAAPQRIVYVNAAPQRVVYVNAYPAPVVYAAPAVYIGATWGGRGWYGHRGHGYYRPTYRRW